MDSAKHKPTYNMKHVVKETGIKPDTLRAWERRYGMPSPQRTRGGHRVYSQNEIESLKWLLARQVEGMSISHAVDLWLQIKQRDEDPLATLPTPATPAMDRTVLAGESLVDLRRAWLSACLKFDGQGAQVYLAQGFAIYPVETVCFELLQRGLQEVGQGWFEGRITVQQEHFVSSQATRQLAVLMAATPAPSRNERILVACPPKEQHTFSPLLITFLLRRRGWDVVYLGADVPLDRFSTAVNTIAPDLVIVSAQTLPTAGTTREMADLMLADGVPLAFGGGVFSDSEGARQRIPGYFLGATLSDIPTSVSRLFERRPALNPVRKRSAKLQIALERFRHRRTLIEAELRQAPALEAYNADLQRQINEQFGDQITAALILGDMRLVDANIAWVLGLVNHHGPPTSDALGSYLAEYYRVVEHHLGSDGAPILDWLQTHLS